jgi:hypothetical protein
MKHMKHLKLKHMEAEKHEAHGALEAPDGRVQRDVKGTIPQIDGRRPVAWPEGMAHILDCLHAEGVSRCASFNFFKLRMGHMSPPFLETRKMVKWGRKAITASRA